MRMTPLDLLREAGATDELAQRIHRVLVDAGFSDNEVRSWLGGHNLTHPIPFRSVRAGHVQMVGVWGALAAISEGGAQAVLDEAEAFADLSPEEREISRALLLPAADARRLAGSDPARARCIVDVLRALRKALKKSTHVYDAAYSLPSPSERTRLIDRLAAGEEADVLQELQRGEIDPRQLAREGIVATYSF